MTVNKQFWKKLKNDTEITFKANCDEKEEEN